MKPIPPPSILQIELTKNCNNACIMCHKGQMPQGKDFNRADISDIALKQVKPVYPYLKHAMLFGDGEPLMFKHFWNVVEDIKTDSPECAIDFINNGSLMNKINARKCLKYQISSIGLSLGGTTTETHAKIRKLSNLNQIIENFAYLKKIKENANTKEPYLKLLVVVMKSNLHELPDFVKLANRLGVISISLQKMFVTHPMLITEVVENDEAKYWFKKTAQNAEKSGIGLDHYLQDVKQVKTIPHKINPNDPIFRQQFNPNLQPMGYCKNQQPWNTVYVLHSGCVVPDCHWWNANEMTNLNICGTLNEKTNIMDVWNGKVYQKLRQYIQKGEMLPQCRGCGLAGGIKNQYRSKYTDYENPSQQNPGKIDKHKTAKLRKIVNVSITNEQREIYRQVVCQTLKPPNHKH